VKIVEVDGYHHVFIRFFIVKSSNRENLELSVARGLWATHRNNESKLNEAFDSCDNVILIFSVNETGHFQVNFGLQFLHAILITDCVVF
jgi:hypothetical protein